MTDSHSPDSEHLLTVADVAERCRLSAKAVRGAINRGELRASKLCDRWRVLPADFREWLAASVVTPSPTRVPVVPDPRPAATSRGSRDRLDAIEREFLG